MKEKNKSEMIKELEVFLFKSFEVDMMCNFVGIEKVVSIDDSVVEGLSFILTDSKRGRFKVTISDL